MEKAPESLRPFGSAKERIRSKLIRQKREQAEETSHAKATEGVDVWIDRGLLDSIQNEKGAKSNGSPDSDSRPPLTPRS